MSLSLIHERPVRRCPRTGDLFRYPALEDWPNYGAAFANHLRAIGWGSALALALNLARLLLS